MQENNLNPHPWEDFLKCSAACLLMALVVLVLPIPETLNPFIEIGIKGSLGALVYGLVVFATNAANCRGLTSDLITSLKERNPVEVV